MILTTWPHYRPKRSFGQGNIFTSVCHSFCSQGGGAPDIALLLGGCSRFCSNFGGGYFLWVGGFGGVFFGRGVPPNFWRGGFLGPGVLQISRGGSSKFPGGEVFSTGIRSTFGRYASYWNAFLFMSISLLMLSVCWWSILLWWSSRWLRHLFGYWSVLRW